jgi:hypothetical protein
MDRGFGHPVQQQSVKLGPEAPQRWPVCAVEPERGRVLTRRSEREVGVKDGEQPPACPARLPPQRQPGSAILSRQDRGEIPGPRRRRPYRSLTLKTFAWYVPAGSGGSWVNQIST